MQWFYIALTGSFFFLVEIKCMTNMIWTSFFFYIKIKGKDEMYKDYSWSTCAANQDFADVLISDIFC